MVFTDQKVEVHASQCLVHLFFSDGLRQNIGQHFVSFNLLQSKITHSHAVLYPVYMRVYVLGFA